MAWLRKRETLYERDGLLELVDEALEHAKAGQSGSLFFTGDAGLGKTTLLEHVAARAEGFATGRGRGAPSESGLAYSVVLSALAELTGEAPFDVSVDASMVRSARGSRFYATLRKLESLSQPSLILLDDLHWSDIDSLELITFLCRRLSGLPIIVVGTLRRWPTTAYEMVSELVSSKAASLHRLEPLSQPACQALLEDLTRVRTGQEVAEQVWHACSGNPLLVHQAARSLETDGSLPSLGVLDAGDQLLLSRFAGAPMSALDYARAASVFGNVFRPELAEQLSGLSREQADHALLTLCGAGLVAGEQNALARFVHPLFRQILYQDLPRPVRARLHAVAMTALIERGASPAEAAEHAVLGGVLGDERAISVLTQAGRSSLENGGVETAVTQLSAAVELAGANVPVDLLLLLSAGLNAAGRPGASIEVSQRALRKPSTTPEQAVQARRLLAHAAFVDGRPEESLEHFRTARSAASSLDRCMLLDTLLDAAFTLATAASVPTLLEFATAARELAASSDTARYALAEVAWGSPAAIGGDPAGFDAVINASEKESGGDSELAISWTWPVRLAQMNVARQLEQYDEASAICESTTVALERTGDPLPIITMAIVHADTLKRLGRLLEASALLERTAALIELVPVAGRWFETARADVDQELGHLVASRCASIADSLGTHLESHPQLWLWLWAVHGDALLAEGQPERAADVVGRCRPLAEQAGIRDPAVIPWARSAIEAAIAAGRLDRAEEEIAFLEDVSVGTPGPSQRALVTYGKALVSWRRCAPETESLFAAAASLLEATSLPLLRARVLLAYGRFLRQVGRPADARPLLAQSLRISEECSASLLARQARDELHVAGGRRRRRQDAPDALTAQERRIIELAAQGLSNPEIGAALYISRKTVESHLGHVYAKIGVSSRRELRRVAPLLSEVGSVLAKETVPRS
ncbi:MAG: helix-turn-helix transcriptional regulator [Acidimicrobiales bacterium]